MKTIKTLLVAVATLAIGVMVNAQELKFGHIDSQSVLANMPDKLAAEKQLQDEATKLEEQLKIMSNDLQQKYDEYITKRDSLPELIRATKEKEIQDADQRIQSYRQMAQQSLAQKEQQLLGPIIEKVQKAIDEGGKENGFVYIFELGSQIILYNSQQSVDVGPLVKAKLGF
jgi:outer membrane protein